MTSLRARSTSSAACTEARRGAGERHAPSCDVHPPDRVLDRKALEDGHGVRDAVARVEHDARRPSGGVAARSRSHSSALRRIAQGGGKARRDDAQGEDGLHRHVHGGHVERLEEDLRGLLAVRVGVERRLGEEDRVLQGREGRERGARQWEGKEGNERDDAPLQTTCATPRCTRGTISAPCRPSRSRFRAPSGSCRRESRCKCASAVGPSPCTSHSTRAVVEWVSEHAGERPREERDVLDAQQTPELLRLPADECVALDRARHDPSVLWPTCTSYHESAAVASRQEEQGRGREGGRTDVRREVGRRVVRACEAGLEGAGPLVDDDGLVERVHDRVCERGSGREEVSAVDRGGEGPRRGAGARSGVPRCPKDPRDLAALASARPAQCSISPRPLFAHSRAGWGKVGERRTCWCTSCSERLQTILKGGTRPWYAPCEVAACWRALTRRGEDATRAMKLLRALARVAGAAVGSVWCSKAVCEQQQAR